MTPEEALLAKYHPTQTPTEQLRVSQKAQARLIHMQQEQLNEATASVMALSAETERLRDRLTALESLVGELVVSMTQERW